VVASNGTALALVIMLGRSAHAEGHDREETFSLKSVILYNNVM